MQSFPVLPVRIGTRGSPLALAQAHMVAAGLERQHGLAHDAVKIVTIRTTGDAVQDRRLSEIGGKGLFTKEIEQALINGAIDLAVHSMKDVETRLPDGLEISIVLEREDPRDVLITRGGAGSIGELPAKAVMGTASLRRGALVKALRQDVSIVTLRGNVGTRLAKLEAGDVDATLLAMAGLRRLGLAPPGAVAISLDEMLPAIAQGAIGLEIRTDDEATRRLIAPLDHRPTHIALAAERALLAELDGSCRTPIAGLAVVEGEALNLDALIARPDGSVVHRVRRTGGAADAARIGIDAAAELKMLGGPGFLAQ